MTQGTERELHEKAERFLDTLEVAAQGLANGRGLNRQTGHAIEINASRDHGRWTYTYVIDGDLASRDTVLDLLRGDWLGKKGTA